MGLVGYQKHSKEDVGASPAELVYGSTITVPGDFTPQSTTMSIPEHLRCLRQQVEILKPVEGQIQCA